MHRDFHQLMNTKSYVGYTRTSILSILWPRHGSAFYPLYPVLALTFHRNIGPLLPVPYSPKPPVGLRVRGWKLEGRISQYQAFACAIAWLLVPALLNLAHPHQPVAIASICQCFHPTPRGGLRLDFVGPRFYLVDWKQTRGDKEKSIEKKVCSCCESFLRSPVFD